MSMSHHDPNDERYSRQILFAPIGAEGQKRLRTARALIVGMGALGTMLANHLVRSGVGYVRFVDRDYVERSNLQRQLLYDETDAEHAYPKVIAAERKLRHINSDITLDAIVADVTVDNIDSLLDRIDVVLDGTDNFQTRLLLNDACFRAGIPFVYGGAVAAHGMTATLLPGETCCLRCLLGSSDSGGQTCDTIGVISPVVAIVASYQAAEALKLLTGARAAVRSSLLTIELWRNQLLEMKLPQPKPDCPTCVLHEYPSLQHSAATTVTLCGRQTVQISSSRTFDLARWQTTLRTACEVQANPFLLKARLPEGEAIVLFPDGRVLVQGTEDVARARTLYDRYIGS